MKRTPIILFTIVFYLLVGNDLYAQMHLKKVKELKIESIYSIDITDYDPTSRQYLALGADTKGFEVVLLNEDGEIILKKNMAGEGPGQINGAFNGLGFSPEGGIWIMSVGNLFYYDKKLNYKRQQKFTSKNQIYRYGNAKNIPFFIRDNLDNNLVFSTYPSGEKVFSMSNNIKSESLLELYDAKKNESYQLEPIAERPIGQKIDNSLKSVFFPVYAIQSKNSLGYVTASIDNEISVINLNLGKAINQIKISHDEFKSLNLSKISIGDLPGKGPITFTAINHKLLILDGGILVLNYIREIPEAAFTRKNTIDRQYHHFKDPFYHRLIFFDQNKQLTKDIPLPKNGRLMIGLPRNRLLFQISDPNVEEDFVRYEIFEVVKD